MEEDGMKEVNLINVKSVIEEVIKTAMETNPDIIKRGDNTFFYNRKNQEMIMKNVPTFKWRKELPNRNVRARLENVVTRLLKLKATARNLADNPHIEDIWSRPFSSDILDTIVHWTNKKSDIHDLDVVERPDRIISVLAVFKPRNKSVMSLFATDGTSRDIFRSTMSNKLFLFLLPVLHFDDPDDRQEKNKMGLQL